MLTYEALVGESITQAARVMVKMANESNDSVTCDFNDVQVVANPGDTPEKIAEDFMAECRRQNEEYLKSPEYARRQKEESRKEARKVAKLQKELKTAPQHLTLRDQVVWDKAVTDSTDNPYAMAIIDYANRWARLMEGRINNGSTLEECADDTSELADTEGITGAMYGSAGALLVQSWIHGDALRRWHDHDESELG